MKNDRLNKNITVNIDIDDNFNFGQQIKTKFFSFKLVKSQAFNINSILENSSGLSFEDCSVWYYSKILSGILLTGDGKLRKQARKDNLEVRGIIYLFDEFLRQGIITFQEAVEKIKQLSLLNNRLPKKEIEKRINLWNENKYVW